MGRSHHEEVERKYDVDPTRVFPDLAETPGVRSVGPPEELELEAVYFDTPGLDLARHGVTLRRRTGGADAGWHLKLPVGRDTRTERREPLGDEGTVPSTLLRAVRALARGRALGPIATVTTARREYPLRDAAGSVLALVSDDLVHGQRPGGSDAELVWREWEVELGDGSVTLLDAVEGRLLAAGAAPAAATSKLARVVGARPSATYALASTNATSTITVEQLLRGQLARHRDRLLLQDAGVRDERPEAIHRLRIAARRLRSALTTFRPLLDTSVTDPVREELRWLGEVLGQARDAQVLRGHLREVLASEPEELVVGDVARRLDDELGALYESGRQAANAALDSDRYLELLETMDKLVAAPPLVSAGDRKARKQVPSLLARDVELLRRAVLAIEAATGPTARDVAFHEARKKTKRLRYAAEGAVPALGMGARSLAASTKGLQETLGTHQDSVVARRRLREYGMQAFLDGENPFTMGRLHALEQQRAEQAEAAFAHRWARFREKQLHQWVG